MLKRFVSTFANSRRRGKIAMDHLLPVCKTHDSAPPIKLSIILPVRNEGVNIPIMLKILNAALEVPYETLFIYDDPADDSIPAVESMQARFPHTRLIRNDLGRGVANAIRAGMNHARGEYMLLFAVDEVGPVLAIDKMLTLMDEGADLVSCTRYRHGGRRLGGSIIGGLLSRCANHMFRWLVRYPLSDATTGIKMFRRSIFDHITLEARPVGWAVAFELGIKAHLAGLKLAEVPIISIDRLYGGTSSFSLGPWLIEYLRWFWWGWRTIRKPRAERPALPASAPPAPAKSDNADQGPKSAAA
jgi:dolichol-phosphate mannosyltransferase